MSVEGAIAAGRTAAEARMADVCVIYDNDDAPQWSETTGQYEAPEQPVYTGRCRVKMPRAMAIEPDAGATTGVVIRPEVHIPASVTGVRVGHRIRITSAAFNPSLAGAVFRVTSMFRDSQATAQRLECTEAQ